VKCRLMVLSGLVNEVNIEVINDWGGVIQQPKVWLSITQKVSELERDCFVGSVGQVNDDMDGRGARPTIQRRRELYIYLLKYLSIP
jgi:hypothetical protein